MQQRHSFVLILMAVFACAAFAQTSTSGGTSAGTAPATGGTAATTPLAPPAGSGVAGTTPATGTAATTPMAPPAGSGVDPATSAATNGATDHNSTNSNTNSGGVINNNGGNNTGGGTGNTGGPQMAPEVHLETVMPAPGATSNQPGAPAGATNMTNSTGSPSSPNTYTVPVQENAPQPQRDPNAASTGPMVQDVNGMVFANGAVSGEVADNRSLAEIAAQYKRGRATQNARVFTNDDIARLNARNDANVMGANQNAALPQGEGAAPAPQPVNAAPVNHKHSPFTPKAAQAPQQANEPPK